MATKTNKNSNNNVVNVINRMHSIMKEYSKDAKETKNKGLANYLMSTVELVEELEQNVKNYIKERKLAEGLKTQTGYLDCEFVTVWLVDELNIKNWVKYHVDKIMKRYCKAFEKTAFNHDSYTEFATAIFYKELCLD